MRLNPSIPLVLLLSRIPFTHPVSSDANYVIDEGLPDSNGLPEVRRVKVVPFRGRFHVPLRVGTPPQELMVQLSLEDHLNYLFDERCAQLPSCNQTAAKQYFQPGRSKTFLAERLIFDASIPNRPGPTGRVIRDVVSFADFSKPIDMGLVDRCPFRTQADGILALGVGEDGAEFEYSFLRALLEPLQRAVVTIVVWPNGNRLDEQNRGMITFGGDSRAGCQRWYEPTALRHPGRQWIFEIKAYSFDAIIDTSTAYSALIRPGLFHSYAPNVFLERFHAYIRARQLDSRFDDFVVFDDNTRPFPDVVFEMGGFQLILKPWHYLEEKKDKSINATNVRAVLLKRMPRDYRNLRADFVFGDNFLQAYCVQLEYGFRPRILFAKASARRSHWGFWPFGLLIAIRLWN